MHGKIERKTLDLYPDLSLVRWDGSHVPLDSFTIPRMGSEAYHDPAKKHIDIIYGDYHFIEAILKLCGTEHNMW